MSCTRRTTPRLVRDHAHRTYSGTVFHPFLSVSAFLFLLPTPTLKIAGPSESWNPPSFVQIVGSYRLIHLSIRARGTVSSRLRVSPGQGHECHLVRVRFPWALFRPISELCSKGYPTDDDPSAHVEPAPTFFSPLAPSPPLRDREHASNVRPQCRTHKRVDFPPVLHCANDLDII